MNQIKQTRKDFYVGMTEIELEFALADDYVKEGKKKIRHLADGLDFLLTNTAKIFVEKRKSNKEFTDQELDKIKPTFLDLIQEKIRGVFNKKQLPEEEYKDVADNVARKYLIYMATVAKNQNRPKAS